VNLYLGLYFPTGRTDNLYRYLSITVDGTKYDNLIWYYQYPTHESAAIEGLISFYRKDFVDILIDGVRI
jgi:uncharacterized protein (DUF427 family)